MTYIDNYIHWTPTAIIALASTIIIPIIIILLLKAYSDRGNNLVI